MRISKYALASALAYCSLFGHGAAGAESSAVRVAEAKFGRAVVAREVQSPFTRSSTVVTPVVLWTRLEGSADALERLRRERRLPIYHKWFFAPDGEVTWDETTDPVDFIDLDVGRSDKVRKLSVEDEERGFFDWRTWSVKKNAYRGSWLVQVVDANDEPLPCAPGLQDPSGQCLFAVRMGD